MIIFKNDNMKVIKIDPSKFDRGDFEELLRHVKSFEAIEIIIEGEMSSGEVIKKIRDFLLRNYASSIRMWVRRDGM